MTEQPVFPTDFNVSFRNLCRNVRGVVDAGHDRQIKHQLNEAVKFFRVVDQNRVFFSVDDYADLCDTLPDMIRVLRKARPPPTASPDTDQGTQEMHRCLLIPGLVHKIVSQLEPTGCAFAAAQYIAELFPDLEEIRSCKEHWAGIPGRGVSEQDRKEIRYGRRWTEASGYLEELAENRAKEYHRGAESRPFNKSRWNQF
ncbi:hypothetical protein FB45DRAFT_35554 [Roridomyces roridus]|uniref:Uncharacterized protein n=1 Tax=Roridomyces roridus TaxID=1738132 RepID=A0AAD7G331_9AGAR|nr:hypothetical protein FB45DRAFT_35554 [Roridomyces roridus]